MIERIGSDKKIDLSKFIYEKLHGGLNGQVIRYFLSQDLMSSLGKVEEYADITIYDELENEVTFNSIYDMHVSFAAREVDGAKEIVGIMNGEEVFKLSDKNNIITNEITCDCKDGEEKYTYVVNVQDNSYSLSVAKRSYELDEEEFKTVFEARLGSIGTKINNYEIFELLNCTPSEDTSKKSFLMRLVSALKNNIVLHQD